MGKADLSKGCWNPTRKLRVTTHFSEIFKMCPRGAPSSCNAKRKELCRSRLFKVTGPLIGVLMIYGGGEGRGLIF